jgi:6-phosphogluconolactonase
MDRTACEVLAGPSAVAGRAAELMVEACASAAGKVAAVCLSGGSTPKLLYELLATPRYAGRLPWDRIHWFWGDERFVLPDHPDSNYKMVRLSMLEPGHARTSTVHPMATTGISPDESAAEYERILQGYYGSPRLDASRPLFDVTLLGLGEDGHTASLFPGVAALSETTRWTAAILGVKPEPRLTLTFPAINASRLVLILVTGSGKRLVLERLERGEDLPVAHVKPTNGRVVWLLDQASAGH